LKYYEGTAKVLFFFHIPKFPKELLLYETPQISLVSPVEIIFEDEEEYGALVERY
jgi:hypothetical protein